MEPQYKRILLKISGESLMQDDNVRGIDPNMVQVLAQKIKTVADAHVEIAIVLGGGNIWRGAWAGEKMNRTTADHMGMLATIINGLALKDMLEQYGVAARVQTAFEARTIAELYIHGRAIHHLEKGRVLILTGGTGNPYFTTDTAAALRAVELKADVLIKATKVDGVYSDNPVTNPTATRYTDITFSEAIKQHLNIMDQTAFTLCRENKMPIIVVNLWENEHLFAAICGQTKVGTLIHN